MDRNQKENEEVLKDSYMSVFIWIQKKKKKKKKKKKTQT